MSMDAYATIHMDAIPVFAFNRLYPLYIVSTSNQATQGQNNAS
jgi:hypothetical protein